MKKLTTLLIASVVAIPLAVAASSYGDRPCGARNGDLTQTLGLSPAQTTQVDAIFAEQAKKREAYRAQRQAQRQADRDAMVAQLSQVLTPAQLEEFKAMQAKRDAWHKERMEKRAEWREVQGRDDDLRPVQRADD